MVLIDNVRVTNLFYGKKRYIFLYFNKKQSIIYNGFVLWVNLIGNQYWTKRQCKRNHYIVSRDKYITKQRDHSGEDWKHDKQTNRHKNKYRMQQLRLS